jgi:hypothetical protein
MVFKLKMRIILLLFFLGFFAISSFGNQNLDSLFDNRNQREIKDISLIMDLESKNDSTLLYAHVDQKDSQSENSKVNSEDLYNIKNNDYNKRSILQNFLFEFVLFRLFFK